MLRTIQANNPSAARIWRAAGLALVAVVAANLLLRAVAYAAFDISSAFVPLQVGPMLLWAALLAGGLTLVRGRMDFSRQAAASFARIAVLSLAVLVALDAVVLLAGIVPGVGVAAILTLFASQSASALLCIYMLSAV